MAKGKLLLGVLIGGAAAVYGTLKLTGTTKEELIRAAQSKVNRFREQNDLEGADWEQELKDRVYDSAVDLKNKVLESKNEFLNAATDSFRDSTDELKDELDEENDVFVNGNESYEAPTEVFMPHTHPDETKTE
ncbi:hypothetical protein ACLJJ6_03410 [Pediococcus siamensis]|uniref:hypothetical protein n=1 Tax=Pediococcus siamensis TaxID=381829 RepID=UPI0039A10561